MTAGAPRGFPLAGRPSGVVSQRDFAERAAALAARSVPGAEAARRAAADLMRETLFSLGYRDGIDILAPFLPGDAPGAAVGRREERV